MTSIFVDSDGVHYDFDGHILALFGKTPRELGDDVMWPMVAAHPTFWLDMPIMEGAARLWGAVKHLKPTVLTGCPKTDYDRAAEHKRIAWKRDFDHEDVITCLSRNKPTHMVAPGDILIDDFMSNVRRWEKAGGRAIWHRSVDETLERLAAWKVI